MSAADFEGAGGVGGELQGRPFALGNHRVTITKIRDHKSTKGSGNGILITVIQAGEERGGRINLGGKFPQYGIRDTKALIAAICGVSGSDPGIVAMDYAAMQPYWSDVERRGWGTEIEIEVFESDRIDPKSGRPHVNFRAHKLGSLGNLGVVPASRVYGAAPAPVPVAPVSAAAAPPPAPPPAPSTPPAAVAVEWFDFPAGDPRAGVEQYNATGATRARA